MITIIITSYNEPKATKQAVNAFLQQQIPKPYKIFVIDPFPEVQAYLRSAFKKNKEVECILDQGEGKSYALNMILSKYFSEEKDSFFIFSDGDVYVSPNAVREILEKFKDSRIGCVTGKPVSLNPRSEKYGYFAKVAFDGIDKVRKKLSKANSFFECSGYLFAVRNGVITEFPIDASEDAIIPFLFWQKGYKIAYAEKAEVYVTNPKNRRDYVAQKVRNIKGHEKLDHYFKLPQAPRRTKSFWNEIKEGFFFALGYPKSVQEFWWTIQLYAFRLYIYYQAFKDLKVSRKEYSDGWREVEIESTKPFDRS